MAEKKPRKQPKNLKEAITPEEEEEPEDPLLDEIVTLFETIKEEGIVLSQAEEHKEITCSNLVLAYYVAKLERKL